MTLLEPARGLRRLGQGLAQHGDRLALAGPGASLTYAALAERVDDVAARLGDTPRLVLAPMANDVASVVGYLGALAAGHPVLLVEDDPARVDALVDRFDPDVLLRTADGTAAVDERRAGTRHDLHPDLALLLSTSGSTGSPRLVRLSHGNLLANATAIAEYLAISSTDRAITSLPLHYCYGLSVLHSHLVRGAGVVLTDRSVVDACFWDAFRAHGVTNLAGVPYTFELLDRVGFDRMSLPTLRLVTQAGGRLDPEHVRRLAQQGQRDGWDLVVMYGQTEATARMAYLPPGLAVEHPAAIGVPIPGGSFRLDRSAGAGPDEGELVYEGPNVMLGYADRPADLATGATLRELRTGDLARRTDAGLYEIIGRRARFAKVCGLRLDLDRLEGSLRQAGIEALCASDDQRVVVAITDASLAPAAAELVRTGAGLPASRVVVTTSRSLPRLPNGKPDHQQVLALAPHATPVDGPATGGVAVRRVLRRVLGVETIGDDDTFVSLGGDSLSYVEASIELESVLGDLPPDWPNLPIGSLVPGGRRSAWFSRTETSVVLRAIAIVLIVGMHVKLWRVLGGAHLLLVMAGFSFGRFQDATAGRLASIARIAVPSALWLALATQLNDRIRLPHLVFANGWFGASDAHGGYWFVEALLQIVVPLTVVLAVPAVARVERANRFAFAAAALALGLLVRFHVLAIPTAEPHDIRPHDIFWMFAIGWAGAHARTSGQRLLLSAVVLGALPGYFGEPQREVLLVIGLLVLLWLPTLPVPRLATRAVGMVAAASLYIYLSHWQVFPPVRRALGPEAAVVAAIGFGILLWQAARAVEAGVRRARARRQPAAGQPGLTAATS